MVTWEEIKLPIIEMATVKQHNLPTNDNSKTREALRQKFISKGHTDVDDIEYMIDDALGLIPAEEFDGNLI